ncbi:MAG: DUF1501 domain-containing protein [Deltaproteobacteria bacterium]|nr:DUF1501 domain-containing protein [Deltaproteobacteria bacterium]
MSIDPKSPPLSSTRRKLLMNTLFGAGLVGLRSLASGIPAAVLLDPMKAFADGTPSGPNPQFVIFSSSGNGDPLNCNVPGTFGFADISHSPDPLMAPTPMTIGAQTYTAAKPWTLLPSWVTQRTCFFHHGTYTVVHPDITKVLKLEEKVAQHEMLPSMFATQLAPKLGTVQAEPISMSPTLTYSGRPQPVLSPAALYKLLGNPAGVIGQDTLQSLRDADLNRLNDLYRSEGNAAQRAFLDRYASAQTQARKVSDALLSTLQNITDNGPDSQVLAALTLIRMRVTPVVGINIPFGGDNHTDTMLANETKQHVAGVNTINNLMTQLDAAGTDDVTGLPWKDLVSFMTLNVFGRTFKNSDNGRNHHGDHHIMVMIGKAFQGSVIGGIEPANNDYRATSIDSATGNAVLAGKGDVGFSSTLSSVGKTLGVGLGLDRGVLDQNISGGKVIPAALAST